MTLKERYRRFRAWQKEPRRYSNQEMEEHHCSNCDHDFTGNYCPVCGQSAGDGRITWAWVRKSIMLLWGMDSHSMPYTIWQLIFRPGYLIGEYISGHRQVSYPPVKMLFLVALFYAIIKQVLDIKPIGQDTEYDDQMFIIIIDWLVQHPGWGLMAMNVLMVLPTWIFFRFAPRHTKHTVPEGIFIQMFMCTIMLLIIILERCISAWLFLLTPFYIYLTYRQLFGYGIWATTWRVLLCFVIWILSLLLLVAILSNFGGGFDPTSIKTFGISLVITAAILGFGYWVGKKNYRPQQTDNQ